MTIIFCRESPHGTAVCLSQRRLGLKRTSCKRSYAFRCNLTKGYYLHMVKATDIVGNRSLTSLQYGSPTFSRICNQLRVR